MTIFYSWCKTCGCLWKLVALKIRLVSGNSYKIWAEVWELLVTDCEICRFVGLVRKWLFVQTWMVLYPSRCMSYPGVSANTDKGLLQLQALATYREALTQNPQSAEVATKVKRLTQVVKEKKRNQQDKQPPKSNGSAPVPDSEPLQLDVVSALIPYSTTLLSFCSIVIV